MFTLIHGLLPELLDCPAHQLWQLLPDLTLIHIQGDREPALLVSVLLHGNETTGWLALQEILRICPIPRRSLLVLIGNVTAAKFNQRRLDRQPDYNRIWGGHSPDPEAQTAQAILAILKKQKLFACVDIHNNTGKNPYYSCVSNFQTAILGLAELFSPIALYYPPTAPLLINALTAHAPSLLLECGQPDQPAGIRKVYEFLHQVLHLEQLPSPSRLNLLETIATVKLPPSYTGAINLPPHLDRYNFQRLPANTLLVEMEQPLLVETETGENLFDQFFHYLGGQILTKQEIFPAMLTTYPQIIRQDCFCYLMRSLAYQFG